MIIIMFFVVRKIIPSRGRSYFCRGWKAVVKRGWCTPSAVCRFGLVALYLRRHQQTKTATGTGLLVVLLLMEEALHRLTNCFCLFPRTTAPPSQRCVFEEPSLSFWKVVDMILALPKAMRFDNDGPCFDGSHRRRGNTSKPVSEAWCLLWLVCDNGHPRQDVKLFGVRDGLV